MQSWVDLGTVVRRSPCQRLHIAVAVAINTTVHSEIQTWVLSHCSRMGALTTKPVWPASLELCSTATHTTEYRQLQAAFSCIMYSSSSSSSSSTHARTHTHTHTHLTVLYPGLPRWAGTRKVKTNLDFTEARDSEWQWYQLGHMQVCTSLQTGNHASTPPLSFFTGWMPFPPPNQQHQSTVQQQCD